MEDQFYIPELESIGPQAKGNRQGRGLPVNRKAAKKVVAMLKDDARRSYEHYLLMLGEGSGGSEAGIARELARINLPLSTYTQWYWKVDLHNLMHFVQLRADPHAQQEIRVYAEQILRIMRLWVPDCTEAFTDYRLNALSLSSTARKAVSLMLRGEDASKELDKLSAREREERIKRSICKLQNACRLGDVDQLCTDRQ